MRGRGNTDMRNDPTDNGGLFIGRRPGTAPLRYRHQPSSRGKRRRRLDRLVAAAILVLEVLLLATLWGPQPLGWLWVGSQVDYLSGSVSVGILSAFIGMLATMMITLMLAKRLDHFWQLARRAGGHDQRVGMLGRIFVVSVVVAGGGFLFWFLIINGPGSMSFSPQA